MNIKVVMWSCPKCETPQASCPEYYQFIKTECGNCGLKVQVEIPTHIDALNVFIDPSESEVDCQPKEAK